MSIEHPVMRQVQFGSLELPATEYEIRDALQKMRATRDMLTNREYSIYNCEIVPQLNEIRLDSASLDELNFLAKRLISLNGDERNIIKGIATKVIPTGEDEIVSIRDLINMTYGTGIVSVVSNVTNDEQLGEFVIENELQDEIALVPEGASHLLDKETQMVVSMWATCMSARITSRCPKSMTASRFPKLSRSLGLHSDCWLQNHPRAMNRMKKQRSGSRFP